MSNSPEASRLVKDAGVPGRGLLSAPHRLRARLCQHVPLMTPPAWERRSPRAMLAPARTLNLIVQVPTQLLTCYVTGTSPLASLCLEVGILVESPSAHTRGGPSWDVHRLGLF